MAWFRFYTEALDDPKVQRLPASVFKGWVNLLCLAKRGDGALPDISEIAFSLRMSERESTQLIETLQQNGLLDQMEIGLSPHNWDGRQYKSDVSNERVKRYRKRQGNAECNVSSTVTETPPETETETETEQNTPPASPPGGGAARKGSRLPDEWSPSESDVAYAVGEGFTEPIARRMALNFRDHFHAKPGAAGRKLDWPRTWQVWVRNERDHYARAPPNNGSGERTLTEIVAEAKRKEGYEDDV